MQTERVVEVRQQCRREFAQAPADVLDSHGPNLLGLGLGVAGQAALRGRLASRHQRPGSIPSPTTASQSAASPSAAHSL